MTRTILDPHACEGVFGPEDLKSLREAYADARKILAASTVGLDRRGQGELSDLLAKAVVAAARGGERDPARLRHLALDHIGSYCRVWGHHANPTRPAGAPSLSLRAFVIDLADYRRAKAQALPGFG